MNKFYSFFDRIGEFITSMAIVIILLVPFMWYRYFEFKTLFLKWLPILDAGDKLLAARMISIVFISITLLFMVNAKRLFKGVNLLLAATAFLINVFFWSLKPGHDWWFVLFISSVIASMDYGLAHLFDNMWKERKLSEELANISSRVMKKEYQLAHLEDEITALEPQIKEYKEILIKCTCPDCDRVFPSPQARNAHKCPTKT